MATLANGSYFIFNVLAGTRVLDVTANSMTDGANVELWDYNQSDAQVWKVVNANGGTKRIVNRLSGKSLDVDSARTAVGTNVQIWTNLDPNWQGQRLAITDAQTTATLYDGNTYDCYYISMSNNLNRVFAATGSTNWSNVQLAEKSGANAQLWCFVPVQPFRDGGVYEIASALNWDLRLDVKGGGKTNGTNVQLYASNHSNAQKFYVTKESGNTYSIRSINSGKYLDVAGGAAANNTNVQIWADTDTRAQRWTLTSYGTRVIDGQTVNCYRIGSKVTNDGATYFLDAANARATSKANVQIHTLPQNWTSEETPYEILWALIPTSAVDPTMPVPYDLGCSDAVLSSSNKSWAMQGSTFYLRWSCADAWITAGPNHYEVRTRHRSMSSYNSTWQSWSAWTQWETAVTTQSGRTSWLQNEFSESYTWDQKKCYELQFQVRAAGVDEGNNINSQIVGQAATKTIKVLRAPTITWQTAGWTPEGIRLGWTSDYRYGSTDMYMTRVGRNGTSLSANILQGEPFISGNNYKSSGVIPQDNLTTWPNDGDTLYLAYEKGYDQAYPFVYETATTTVAYDAGTTSVEPTFQWSGVRLYAIVPQLGTARQWVRVNNQLFECSQTNRINPGSGKVAFEVIYPMNKPFDVFTESHNASGSSWGTDITECEAVYKFFHGFNWAGGGSAYLEQFSSGDISYQETNDAVYQADVLDSRANESVSSADTIKTHYTITGVITPECDSGVEDFRAMINQHVMWRSPNGVDVADVYIASVNFTETHNRTEVSISAIKETR